MDPSFSNFCMNLGDSGGYSNSQYYENTPFFSNPSQVDVTENIQTSQDTEKQPRGKAWDVAEDVALMSSRCLVSENSIRGNNQKATSLWAKVKKLYDEAQVENPEKSGKKNVQQMKGRYKRLNESVQKWVGAYREAYRRMKSGMSQKDVECEAHKIYEQEVKNKFSDSVVFNEVMCNHPKGEARFDEWQQRVFQENRRVEDIMIELLIRDHPRVARRGYCNREREQGEARLMQDYFVENPTYDRATFRRRFRMQKPLFLRIVAAVTANDRYFQQRRDATGRKGLSPLQKCTRAMRVLAYETSADAHDEYLRMSETVTRDSLIHFVEGVISCFGQEYLRRPNDEDLVRLLHVGVQRGFPGMIGSIDCMHWEWKSCPIAWVGQYAGRSGKPTIILEVIVSYDLWIWHAFFGTAGSCNDINVLQRSPVFDDLLSGRASNVSYVVNGHDYNMTYYLTDGIYPSWAAFVKSITSPQLRKHKLFAQHQEAVRKDVERAFGVLQARFAFLRHPCLVWDKDMMEKIMIACIIIHNMIVENERDIYLHSYDPSEFLNDTPTNRQHRRSTEDDEQPFRYSTERIANLSSYMTNRTQLCNREAHNALKNDLIEHIWQKFSFDE